MRLRNLLFLYIQRVRTHPLEELLALVGIAVGVALVFAVQVANTSVVGSVKQLVHGITGSAQLQVASRDPLGFDQALSERIARVPGVQVAAPIVEIRVGMRGRGALQTVTLIGGDQRLVSLHGALLREFASPHLQLTQAIALPTPLAASLGADVDAPVRVGVGARSRRVPIGTMLTRDQIGPLVDSPVALAPLAYAQEIGNMHGRVTRILVKARRGRIAAVRAALERLAGSSLNVTSGGQEATLLEQAAQPNDQSTALFAAISALVGLLFAFNAMLLTVPERRRFLADLRLEGLGDLTVVGLVVFDALILGIAASLLGLFLGDQLSRHAFHSVPGYLSFAFAVGDQRIVDARSVVLAVLGGIGATLLAGLRPLSDLLSRRPLDDVYREDDERDEDAVVPRRWLLLAGVALVAIASAVLLLAAPATVLAIVLLLTGMLLLLPGIIASIVRVIDALSHRLRSPVLVIAVGELRATTTRSIALAATGALAVFGSVAVEGAHFDVQRGLDRDAHGINAQADLWISPAGEGNVLATTPFRPPPSAAKLAALPGVRAVRAYRGAFLNVDDRRVWVLGPPRSDPAPLLASQIVHGDLASATRRLRSHGWVAISDTIAAERHLHLGDVVRLPTPHAIPLRLAATLTNLGWSSGAIVINASDFRTAWASSDVSALQLLLRPRGSPAETANAAARVLRASGGLAIETAGQREQRFRTNARQGLNRLTQIATLVLVAAALALATAMGGVIWSRRPRLVTLKLTGFDDGAVWRSLVLESAIVLGIGCSIGALFGLYGQWMLTRWLTISTGFPTRYEAAGWLALSTFAGITVVAVAIAALPGYAAARVPPTARSEN
jgi:putative ABC transport system permease protein